MLLLALPFFSSAQENEVRLSSVIAPEKAAQLMERLDEASALQSTRPDSLIGIAGAVFEESRATGYNAGMGRSLGLIGVAYRNLGAYEKSIACFRRAIYFIERQDKDREFYLASAYNAMFGSYFPRGLYDSAAMNCYKVIELYKDAGILNVDPGSKLARPLIDAYQYLGLCWMQLGFHQQAQQYLEKAEHLSRQSPGQYQLPGILLNKGAVYMERHQPDSALAIFREGLQSASDPQSESAIPSLRVNIAGAFLEKGEPEKAAPVLEKILSAPDDSLIPDDSRISAVYLMARIHSDHGRYDEALSLLLPAMKLARERDLKYNSLEVYPTLAAIYKAKNRPDLAYEQLLTMHRLSDSMLSKDKIQAINLLDIALQTSEKNKKIAQGQLLIANQQHKIDRKNSWLTAISFSALLLIFLFAALYRSNRHKRRLQEEKIRYLSKEQEVIQLQAFIKGEEQERTRFARELHDGFISQLSAVKMSFAAMEDDFPRNGKFAGTIAQLDDTIRELRKTAHNLMPEVLLRGGLAEAVQLFCERMAEAHRLSIDFLFYGFVPRLNAEFELTVYRMIQETVQNVVRHARATRAIVQINCADNNLGITVEDNGCGMDTDNGHNKGSGLAGIASRVKALNGTMHISSEQGIGTTIYFEFDTSAHLNQPSS